MKNKVVLAITIFTLGSTFMSTPSFSMDALRDPTGRIARMKEKTAALQGWKEQVAPSIEEHGTKLTELERQLRDRQIAREAKQREYEERQRILDERNVAANQRMDRFAEPHLNDITVNDMNAAIDAKVGALRVEFEQKLATLERRAVKATRTALNDLLIELKIKPASVKFEQPDFEAAKAAAEEIEREIHSRKSYLAQDERDPDTAYISNYYDERVSGDGKDKLPVSFIFKGDLYQVEVGYQGRINTRKIGKINENNQFILTGSKGSLGTALASRSNYHDRTIVDHITFTINAADGTLVATPHDSIYVSMSNTNVTLKDGKSRIGRILPPLGD